MHEIHHPNQTVLSTRAAANLPFSFIKLNHPHTDSGPLLLFPQKRTSKIFFVLSSRNNGSRFCILLVEFTSTWLNPSPTVSWTNRHDVALGIWPFICPETPKHCPLSCFYNHWFLEYTDWNFPTELPYPLSRFYNLENKQGLEFPHRFPVIFDWSLVQQ